MIRATSYGKVPQAAVWKQRFSSTERPHSIISELRSCVKVEVDVKVCPSLIQFNLKNVNYPTRGNFVVVMAGS